MSGFVVFDHHTRAALSRVLLPGARIDFILRRMLLSPALRSCLDGVIVAPTLWGSNAAGLGMASSHLSRGPDRGVSLTTLTHLHDPAATVRDHRTTWRRAHINIVEWRANRDATTASAGTNATALAAGARATIDAGMLPVLTVVPRTRDGHVFRRSTIEGLLRLRNELDALEVEPSQVWLRIGTVDAPDSTPDASTAEATVSLLEGCVPPDVRGVAFISGNTTFSQARRTLDEIHQRLREYGLGHQVAIGYGRAVAHLLRRLPDPYDLNAIEHALIAACRPLDSTTGLTDVQSDAPAEPGPVGYAPSV